MYALLESVFLFLAVIWLGWIFIATQPCERVYRFAHPVAIISDVLRAGLNNWVSDETKANMLRWQFEAEVAVEHFAQREFYNSLTCSGVQN